ncbi:MAG: peroxide stress protein YaaA [Candidatus Planktophila sp.]|nr:peroxide stress protein YaaA [Candidatus Planktophila sp.]
MHTWVVLILLPPSEKKSSEPGAAIEVYAGVLYAALGWKSLTPFQQKLAQESVVMISAKYGAIRPLDPIQPYKEKIANKEMAPKVAQVLDAIESELIIDCRSSTYQTVWQSPTEKTIEVKVFTLVDGQKKVITHMSKKTRGEVTRCILENGERIGTPEQLHTVVSKNFTCKIVPASTKEPWVLEVYC